MVLERLSKTLKETFSERRDMPGEIHEIISDLPYQQDQAMREEMPEPAIARR